MLAHTRKVFNDRDTVLFEMISWTNTGKHENLDGRHDLKTERIASTCGVCTAPPLERSFTNIELRWHHMNSQAGNASPNYDFLLRFGLAARQPASSCKLNTRCARLPVQTCIKNPRCVRMGANSQVRSSDNLRREVCRLSRDTLPLLVDIRHYNSSAKLRLAQSRKIDAY